jgi:uncharacterized membrane protein
MTKKISERVAGVFRKVGDGVLSLRRLPRRVAHRPRKLVTKMPEEKLEEVPARFKDFFERRQAGWPEYIMLKAQLAILALFAVSVTYIALARAQIVFLVLISAFSAYAVYLALTQLKRAFKRDYPAYRGFVIMCVCIAWAFVLALGYLPNRFGSIYTVTVPALIAVLFALLAFTAFRLKYGRNYTYGVVQDVSGDKAMVMVGYDLRSNVKSGIYTVDSFAKVEKGNAVKLSVERPMMGLRGAKLKAVLEKLS